MSDWTWKTLVRAAWKDCCHFEAGAPALETSTSSGATCTRLSAAPLSHLTVAVSRYVTPSSRAISCGVFVVFR